MAREESSGLVRSVIERGNRLIDALLCRRSHVRLAIDHARYGLYGYAGEIGYVEYGGIWHG